MMSKQLQYLFYIDRYKDSGRLISDLAEKFGVTKGAVSQILNLYEKNGFIQRDDKSISLAAEAEKEVLNLKKKHSMIYPFFQAMPNFTNEMAQECALQYLCEMPKESVEGLVSILESKEKINCIRWDIEGKAPDTICPFPEGSYEIPFNVYKVGKNELSMGDRGFVKFAQMNVLNGKGTITLKAKEIRYKDKAQNRFRGKLTKLSCLYEGNFISIYPKHNEFVIPIHYIHKLSLTPDGTLLASLRIKAEVRNCLSGMPVSEADVVLRFI